MWRFGGLSLFSVVVWVDKIVRGNYMVSESILKNCVMVVSVVVFSNDDVMVNWLWESMSMFEILL